MPVAPIRSESLSRQPNIPAKKNYQVYCLYHNEVNPRFYGAQQDELVFVKMDKGPYVFPARKHIPLAKMPWFKAIGKEWVEYEFYYSLYKGNQEGLIELPEYLGFIQYDMGFFRKKQSVLDFVDQEILTPETLVSFQPYDASYIWNQNVLVGAKNCLEVILEEYNGKFGINLQIGDLLKGRLDMCGSFLIHRSLFARMMDFLSAVIECGRLQPYENTEKRTRGLLLERYAAVFLWAQNPRRLEFHLPHYFVQSWHPRHGLSWHHQRYWILYYWRILKKMFGYFLKT